MAKLAAYRAKRDFTKTSEPAGKSSQRRGASFVVQKHDASRLHYDFRLEVEDHPLEYGGFEGTIPEGQYGGGTVLLWDRGTWDPEGDAHDGYEKGRLTFRLDGEKLKGTWHLVRMAKRPRERQTSWLLIKAEDPFARSGDEPDILNEAPLSVKSGRSIEEIAPAKRAESLLKPKASSKKPEKTKAKETARSSKRAPSKKAAADTVDIAGVPLTHPDR